MKYSFESMISELLQHNKKDIDVYFSCLHQSLDKSIKIISSRIDISSFEKFATTYWWTLEQPILVDNSDVRYVHRNIVKEWLGKHWLHSWWLFYVQEVAAWIPARFIPSKQWDIVLDMCAAPGWKSVQIADTWAFVVSNEISSSRIVPLQHNLNRTGMRKSCITSLQWGNRWNTVPNFFDHVLVDAPCSGEGTGFKSDDGIKWRQQDNVLKIARLQKEILASAIKACKPWGTIIYSTCTINPRENEQVVAFALEKFGDVITLDNVAIPWKSNWVSSWEWETLLSVENAQKVARFWPHIQKTWWFFIAFFTKKSPTEYRENISKNIPSQLDISQSLQDKVSTLLNQDFGISINPLDHLFVSSQKKIFLTHPDYKKIHDKIYIEKTWIPIYKINNNWERSPLHGLGQCLGHLATKNILDIWLDHIQKYSEWFDITYEEAFGIVTTKNRYCIIKVDNYAISVGKIVDGTIKNKFIK